MGSVKGKGCEEASKGWEEWGKLWEVWWWGCGSVK